MDALCLDFVNSEFRDFRGRQAQQLLDRYITPEGQEKKAEDIANSLDKLFGEQ